jgi:hypothetical protein
MAPNAPYGGIPKGANMGMGSNLGLGKGMGTNMGMGANAGVPAAYQASIRSALGSQLASRMGSPAV